MSPWRSARRSAPTTCASRWLTVPANGITGLAVDFLPPADTGVPGMSINYIPLTGTGVAVLEKSDGFTLDGVGHVDRGRSLANGTEVARSRTCSSAAHSATATATTAA